jgi:two-component system, LytTR family, sensor kinase
MAASIFLKENKPDQFYRRYRILFHILFWVGIFIYDVVIWGLVDSKYGEKLLSTSIELPIKMAAAYFTLYVLIDRFLIKKKYEQFFLLLFLSMIVVGIILRLLAYYVIYPINYPEGLVIPILFLPKILIAIFYTYAWVAIVATIHLRRKFYEHQQETNRLQLTAQQLEKEKLAAELKLLKSQIHPHFLFNTLNNLYALTINDTQKAPAMVHKLSELMSYMLYDSNQPLVPLEKEVHYLRNYIDLEKLRYGDRLEVTFSNYIRMDGIKVAPLLMLPFVENSFKHGVRNKYTNGWIHIELAIIENVLVLKVENNKPETKQETGSSGLGLKNVSKRLEHLYPELHSLQIFDTPETHLIILQLSLP